MNKVFFFCLMIFFYCLTGCQKTEVKNDAALNTPSILRLNLGSEPHSLDPRRARDLNSLSLVRMCFEGLTRIGPQETPELALAKEVHISEDLKTYTFILKAAKWSNGDPVTASDFVYAWKKALDPKFASDQAFQLYVIKNAKAIKEGKLSASELGARAKDAITLEVELDYPIPYFLELTAFPTFFPIHQVTDEQNPRWSISQNTYVCNGPFFLESWKPNDVITVKKNPQYWDVKSVKLDEIQLIMVSEDVELKMYEKKELDWAGSPLSTLPVDALRSLKQEGLVRIRPIAATYFLRVHTEKPPFDNLLMRKAFALAIERQPIVEHITQGGQLVATGLVPPAFGLQEEPYLKDGSIEEARALFKQALKERSLSLETLPKIILTYAAGERNHLIAQALQHQWLKTFDVKVQLEAVEKKVFFDRLSKQDYSIASGAWFADFNDPINFLEVFKYKTASTNNTKWEDAEYVRLLNDSNQIGERALRNRLLSQSEKILMEQMPIIPIFHFSLLYLQPKNLKGVILSSLGNIDFKWAYWDNPEANEATTN